MLMLGVGLFVRPSKMMFGPTKGSKSLNIIKHNLICPNHITESFVLGWLCTHGTYDVRFLPAFVIALDVISSLWSIINSVPATPL